MAETSIKFYYFDSQGGGETTRLILTLGGIAFEDVRMTREQFAEKKA